MVAVASFVLLVLWTASADADINPVVVPATIGSSITKEVDANTQMIFEYKVLLHLHTFSNIEYTFYCI